MSENGTQDRVQEQQIVPAEPLVDVWRHTMLGGIQRLLQVGVNPTMIVHALLDQIAVHVAVLEPAEREKVVTQITNSLPSMVGTHARFNAGANLHLPQGGLIRPGH